MEFNQWGQICGIPTIFLQESLQVARVTTQEIVDHVAADEITAGSERHGGSNGHPA